MSASSARRIKPTTPVLHVDEVDELSAILADEVDGVIWNRRIPASVLSGLNAAPLNHVPDGRFSISVDQVSDRAMDHFRSWGWPKEEVQGWVSEDVQALACVLGNILSTSQIKLRIELVRGDACRKFHRDRVRARLICTYAGPGTEYGRADGGDQPRLSETVPTGAPILLKGSLWPTRSQRSVLHRSPPVEGTGAFRLVVVLDEAPSASPR